MTISISTGTSRAYRYVHCIEIATTELTNENSQTNYLTMSRHGLRPSDSSVMSRVIVSTEPSTTDNTGSLSTSAAFDKDRPSATSGVRSSSVYSTAAGSTADSAAGGPRRSCVDPGSFGFGASERVNGVEEPSWRSRVSRGTTSSTVARRSWRRRLAAVAAPSAPEDLLASLPRAAWRRLCHGGGSVWTRGRGVFVGAPSPV